MRHPRRPVLIAAIALAVALVVGFLTFVLATDSTGRPSADLSLRTVNASAGAMVVTGRGMTVYIYLPDPTRPSASTCIGDCANDWPPIQLTTTTPITNGIPRSRIGVLTRPNGIRQLTLNGYPLYSYAGDHRPGETRGESVGNTWFAITPDGSFLSLPPAAFTPSSPTTSEELQVVATPEGSVVADGVGQTLYAYKDDTATTSACTASWCTQDWPPLLVKQVPAGINGISAALGLLRRPDGTLQLTLAGHPVYIFAGDERRGDLRGQGIGQDWYPIAPNGSEITSRAS